MRRFKWIIQNKVTGETAVYSSPYGQCTKDSVYNDPCVKSWANGNDISIFPTEQ
jgi:hypothetical protein